MVIPDQLPPRRSCEDLAALLREERFLLYMAVQGLTAAARRVGSSERSLQRAAAALGTNIRALVAEVHMKVAEDLFRKGNSVREVAGLLGYARPASLARFVFREYGLKAPALRRWLLRTASSSSVTIPLWIDPNLAESGASGGNC
jgi:AraC-like DNA-binding protein